MISVVEILGSSGVWDVFVVGIFGISTPILSTVPGGTFRFCRDTIQY